MKLPSKESDMCFSNFAIFRRKKPNHKGITDVVSKRHEESRNNQSQKILVILRPNTVVDPATVMVKIINTPVASAAVF